MYLRWINKLVKYFLFYMVLPFNCFWPTLKSLHKQTNNIMFCKPNEFNQLQTLEKTKKSRNQVKIKLTSPGTASFGVTSSSGLKLSSFRNLKKKLITIQQRHKLYLHYCYSSSQQLLLAMRAPIVDNDLDLRAGGINHPVQSKKIHILRRLK